MNYKIVTWHGESGSLFHVIDADATDIEVITSFPTREQAQSFIGPVNHKMLEELYSNYRNPFDEREVVIENTAIHCSPMSSCWSEMMDWVHIHSMRALFPRLGNAHKAMKVLTDMADRHQVTLHLIASPYKTNIRGSIISKKQLIKFYQKHGFVLTRKNDIAMLRKPKR